MAWDAVHLFECPTQSVLWARRLATGAERLRELGVERPLVVSDPGVAAAGIVDRIEGALRAAGLEPAVYAETESNPTTQDIAQATALYREHGCDGLVGLGGGSSMDCAKGTGLELTGGEPIARFVGRDNVPDELPPLVCIPTTCGTGSEVTFVAVITDPDVHFKLVFADRKLGAKVALVDPDLVEAAPAPVIAATGADALAHAVESYVNRGSDPLLGALNIAAIRMIGGNLVRLWRRGIPPRSSS